MKLLPPEWHEELPSTNLYLLELLTRHNDIPTGIIVAARRQTAGRGREGRIWHSSPGRDLTFSCLLRPAVSPDFWPSLGQAAAVAVAETVQARKIPAALKWPNDVRVKGRKIAGLLVESVAPADRPEARAFVLGIGLNINLNAVEAERLDQPATSLFMETGREETPEVVLTELSTRLEVWLQRWAEAGFAALREFWQAEAESLGQLITVGREPRQRHGRLHGFGERGELLLEDPVTGRIEPIWSGECR